MLTAGKLGSCSGPSGFAVKQPLIRGQAEAACHSRDGMKIGAETCGWNEDAAEVSGQVAAADGGFHTQYYISELLVVADLAAANEPALPIVEPFAGGEADIGPVNLTPGATCMDASVEASPTYGRWKRISSR